MSSGRPGKAAALGGAVGAALVVATLALAGTPSFLLGSDNTVDHTTTLRSTGAFSGPQLQVKNTAGGAALDLQVNSGKPPMTVNSTTRVVNLNAEELDGYRAAHFLPATGTAADTDKLGGIDSKGFLQGTGWVLSGSTNVSPGSTGFVHIFRVGWQIAYLCPANIAAGGQVAFENFDTGAQVFADNGGTDPSYIALDQNQALYVNTSPGGEAVQFKAALASGIRVNVFVYSVHTTDPGTGNPVCHVQAHAVENDP